MINFNALLRDEGLNPAEVKLARHQDKRFKGRPTPYQIWRAADGRFDLYQRIQIETKFKGAKLLASFIATPLDETLFVGLYEIGVVAVVPQGMIDPISGSDVGGYHLYSLELSPYLSGYRGRLVVDWGQGYRAWVQYAQKQDKPVLEIRRSIGDPPFPGFLNFRESLSMLKAVPMSWRQTLSAVSGVYLLTCPQTGKQYVGSAGGETGFWGRWEDYAASGHGGNKRMIDIPAADYLVAILEVASSTAGLAELIAIENRWKEKLRTRQFGLNAN